MISLESMKSAHITFKDENSGNNNLFSNKNVETAFLDFDI
jgi:hypothetical protein